LKSQASLATEEFNYDYDIRQAALELEREQINAKAELSQYDQTRLESIDESLVKLQEDRQKEQSRLRRSTWQRLQHAADTAEANRQQVALFYTLGFVFGTMVLTIGLLIVGLTGQGAQSWICMGILAIIAFSLFVGGTAWIGRFLP
jgi:ABC-type transport system involved in cytochrome bd biosynthesis fused ATPase/permease subunit